MPRFACTGCSGRFDLAEDRSAPGERMLCPKCGRLLAEEAASFAATPSPVPRNVAIPPIAAHGPEPRVTSGRTVAMILATIASIGLLAMLCVGGTIFAFVRSALLAPRRHVEIVMDERAVRDPDFGVEVDPQDPASAFDDPAPSSEPPQSSVPLPTTEVAYRPTPSRDDAILYRLTITSKLDGEPVRFEGDLSFRSTANRSDDEDSDSLLTLQGLASLRSVGRASRTIVDPIPIFETVSNPGLVTISRNGEIVGVRSEQPSPCLLGNFYELPIVTLPDVGQAERIIDSTGFLTIRAHEEIIRLDSPGALVTRRVPLQGRRSVRIVAVDDDGMDLRLERSESAEDERSTFRMDVGGTARFDFDYGLITSLKLDGKYLVRTDGIEVTAPVALTVDYISAEALAEAERRRAEANENAARTRERLDAERAERNAVEVDLGELPIVATRKLVGLTYANGLKFDLSPDGRLLAVRDRERLRFFDTTDGEERVSLGREYLEFVWRSDSRSWIAFASGETHVGRFDGTLELEPVRRVPTGSDTPITGFAAVSYEADLLVVTGALGRSGWSLASGQSLWKRASEIGRNTKGIALDGSGQGFELVHATGATNRLMLERFDLRTGETLSVHHLLGRRETYELTPSLASDGRQVIAMRYGGNGGGVVWQIEGTTLREATLPAVRLDRNARRIGDLPLALYPKSNRFEFRAFDGETKILSIPLPPLMTGDLRLSDDGRTMLLIRQSVGAEVMVIELDLDGLRRRFDETLSTSNQVMPEWDLTSLNYVLIPDGDRAIDDVKH